MKFTSLFKAIMDRIYKAVIDEVNSNTPLFREMFKACYERKRARYEEGYTSFILNKYVRFRELKGFLQQTIYLGLCLIALANFSVGISDVYYLGELLWALKLRGMSESKWSMYRKCVRSTFLKSTRWLLFSLDSWISASAVLLCKAMVWQRLVAEALWQMVRCLEGYVALLQHRDEQVSTTWANFSAHDLSTGTVGPPLTCCEILLEEWKEGNELVRI